MTRLWRVRDRATFAALRREGVRRRAGALTVTHLPGPERPSERDGGPGAGNAALAFAVGRSVGNAVERNRLRRRLRSIVAEVGPAPGTYLFTASPEAGTLSYQDLRGLVQEALA